MSKMFNKGSELMSAKEIVIVYGTQEKVQCTAGEYMEFETLQKKATPTEPVDGTYCPHCHTRVERYAENSYEEIVINYCHVCGQSLEWGE